MNAKYTEEHIISLSWNEHVRMRPGMYIGKVGNGSSRDDGIYVLLKETIDNNSTINITGMAFEKLEYNNIYYPFTWLKNNELKGRDNDYVKAKDMDFEFMIETLHNIFPKLNIIVQS